MHVRPAAVSGLFYEAETLRLAGQLNALLAAAPSVTRDPPRALIVPHAGYVYSGRTAAAAYKLLEGARDRIHRVALFGPAHRVYLKGMAVPSAELFATPLGGVLVDRVGIEQIASLPEVFVNDEAHRDEHSIEVQLPFLQTVLEDFSLVPVVVGDCAADAVAKVMDRLTSDPATLLVVSTDLSHFHRYEEAQRRDALTCEHIVAGKNTLTGEQACGARVLNGFLSSALFHSSQLELLQCCNSGDTAGDRDRVVGYGAFSLH